jgi:hypothetical protein
VIGSPGGAALVEDNMAEAIRKLSPKLNNKDAQDEGQGGESLGRRVEVLAIRRILAGGLKSLVSRRDLGEQVALLSQDSKVAVRGSGWLQKLAEEVDKSTATLTKAKQFYLDYSAAEAANLDALGIRWAAVDRVLSLPDKKERLRLLKEAKKNNTSSDDVRLVAREKKANIRGGGRPRKAPNSHGPQSDLVELGRKLEEFGRMLAEIVVANMPTYFDQMGRLSNEKRQVLEKLIAAFQAHLDTHMRECGEAKDRLDDFRDVLLQGGAVGRTSTATSP